MTKNIGGFDFDILEQQQEQDASSGPAFKLTHVGALSEDDWQNVNAGLNDGSIEWPLSGGPVITAPPAYVHWPLIILTTGMPTDWSKVLLSFPN